MPVSEFLEKVAQYSCHAVDRQGDCCSVVYPKVALEKVAFFSDLKPGTYVALRYVDDPDVWHEALVTSPSLGVDRAAAILTPVAPVLLFLMTVSIASRPNGDLLCRVLEGGRRWLEADGDRPVFPRS